MMSHAQMASPSPDDRDARREMDDAQRETVYRLMWLASLWLFPSEEQYARIFPDDGWPLPAQSALSEPPPNRARRAGTPVD